MDKISIIVPVYNVEYYLEYCINSIFAQTYKNLEIILVDDGSTDSSGKICDEFAKVDNRVKVIHKENGGLSSARNCGLKIATGNYIGFLDSDDCIVPDFYEYLFELIHKNNADIAQGNFFRIPIENINRFNDIINEQNNKLQIHDNVYNNIQALTILYGISEKPYVQEVVVWNKLYKKELFSDTIFAEGKLHEDEYTTHKILFKCKKLVVSNRYIHGYMQTKNSIMRKEISFKRVKDCLGASLEAIKFFQKNNLDKLIYKIYIRYLCNSIELSGKILKEESIDKKEKLDYIENQFVAFFENNSNVINSQVSDDLENAAMSLITKAYNSVKQKHNLGDFWNDLNELLQK